MITIFKSTDAKADYIAFNRYNAMRGKRILLSSLFPIVMITLAIQQIASGEMWFGIFTLAIGLGFTPLMFFLNEATIKRHLVENEIYSSIISTTVEFGEDAVKLTTDLPSRSDSNDFKYQLLAKATETNSHFFIYITPSQAIIVKKSTLQQGSISAARSILAQNLGHKFKTKALIEPQENAENQNGDKTLPKVETESQTTQ